MQQLIEKQPPQPCAALVVDDLAGKAGRIDRRTLEILVPVIPLAHQAPLHILLPERRPAIDTEPVEPERDRKSTRLNSSHGYISYAVFCLKKKKKKNNTYCVKYRDRVT